VKLRDDAYGGDLDRRLKFLREVIADIRARCATDSSLACAFQDRGDESGLSQDESCRRSSASRTASTTSM